MLTIRTVGGVNDGIFVTTQGNGFRFVALFDLVFVDVNSVSFALCEGLLFSETDANNFLINRIWY
jgi:hypothetical protein